jgi:hypothetical protein
MHGEMADSKIGAGKEKLKLLYFVVAEITKYKTCTCTCTGMSGRTERAPSGLSWNHQNKN